MEKKTLEDIEAQIVPCELLCEECGTTLSVFDDECEECGQETFFSIDAYYADMREQINSKFENQSLIIGKSGVSGTPHLHGEQND